jgi:hypothetical protein
MLIHLPVVYSHILIIEFFPSYALAIKAPLAFISKQQMGAEWPKKNLFWELSSKSIAMRVPPEVKRTVLLSLGKRDHFRLRHLSGE